MKSWLLLIGVGIVAVFAFQQRERFLPLKVPAASTVTAERPPAAAAPDPVAPVRPSLPSPQQAPSAEQQPTPDDAARKAELAALVSQSQKAALARYPALGEATSEMNIRFNYRYKRMLAEYSPRLQDPAWPLQLADECAQATGIRPAVKGPATAPLPPKPATAPQTASMPPRPVPSASVPAQAVRITPPPAAQTLAFHPAATGAPQVPAAPSAPPASNALPFVTLDAVNQNTKNNYTYNWGSYYGWYDISYRQSVGISINLKNMGRVPTAVKVRWIFFARNGASSARFIFAASGKELDLTPGQGASLSADSPLIRNREINYGWIGERYMYGSKYEGWLVQLMERGSNRVIKQIGSTSYLEDLAKRSEFAATLEDYRTKLHGQNVTGL